MTDFFKKPNLPDKRVKTLIIGEGYAELLEPFLSRYGVSILRCPPNPFVDSRLASHADLNVFHMGGQDFVLAKYLEDTVFSRALADLGAKLHYSEKQQGREYPKDANLCALNAGGIVFHNQRLTDPIITKGASKFVHVSQGYAKCAVCMVDEHSAITADEGMARALREQKIEVLQISPDGVALEGYASGFIGGAAFKLSPDEIFFTGNLDAHPDRLKIEDFLQKRNKNARFLSKSAVFDIGSAIPVF